MAEHLLLKTSFNVTVKRLFHLSIICREEKNIKYEAPSSTICSGFTSLGDVWVNPINFHLQPISKSRSDQFDVLVSHSNIYQMIYPPLFPTAGTQGHNWSCSHYYWQCLSITWSVNIQATELLGSMTVWSLGIFWALWRMPWAAGLNIRIIIC